MKVIALRPNQPFLVGEKVRIGKGRGIFEIVGLGLCTPELHETVGEGIRANGTEFVQLKVPGEERRLFHVHSSFLRRVNREERA